MDYTTYAPGMTITQVHVTLNGEGQDIPFGSLDVEEHPTANQLKVSVESHLGLTDGTLRNYQADAYTTTGVVVLRPSATLGSGVAPTPEADVRLKIMDSLITCPHRQVERILGVHVDMMKADPEFYAHLAVWAQANVTVRDHKEAFIACLLVNPHPELREVSYVLLQGLPVYQVARIISHVEGTWVPLIVRAGKEADKALATKAKTYSQLKKDALPILEAKGDLAPIYTRIRQLFELPADTQVEAKTRTVRRGAGKDKPREKAGTVQCSYYRPGLAKNMPRILHSAGAVYLRRLERDGDRFEYATIREYEDLKGLYRTLRVRPSERANQTLFGDPPEGSKRAVMKQIAKLTDPVAYAKAIVQHSIPYPVAVGLMGQKMTPVHLVGLIQQMTAQELLGAMNAITTRGALENPEVKALVDQKLGKATSKGKVDALKAQKAVQVMGSKVSGETRAKMEAVTDARIAKMVKITKGTCLAIDASSSMANAIDLGKEIGSLVAPCCKGDFLCVSFNDMTKIHDVTSDKKSEWDKAFKYVSATGCTNIGAVVEAIRRSSKRVEQVILVTDEGENRSPTFAQALDRYRKETSIDVNVVIVRCGQASSKVEIELRGVGVTVDVFNMVGKDADYYSLPSLLPMLGGSSRTDLLMTIMDIPLPTRAVWDAKNLAA